MSKRKSKQQVIEDFIAFLERLLRTTRPLPSSSGRLLIYYDPDQPSRNSQQSVYLTQEETQDFQLLLQSFEEAKGMNDSFSRDYLDKMMTREVVDVFESAGELDFDEDLSAKLSEARRAITQSLDQPVTRWRIVVRVLGMKLESFRSWKFGSVKFFHGDTAQIDQLEEQMWGRVSETSGMRRRFLDGTLAETWVEAVDLQAASAIGNQTIRLTLDVLNFYASIFENPAHKIRVEPCYGFDGVLSSMTAVISENEKGIRGVFSPLVSPVKHLQPNVLDFNHFGLDRVNLLLSKPNLTEVEERLIAAFQWSGRAWVASTSNELVQAFLYYTIALESLLGPKGKSEITYSLSLRVALLLGNTFEERQSTVSEFKYLYGLRSAIVHRGGSEVTRTDLATLQAITKNTILAFLYESEKHNLCTDQNLEDWINRLLLS